MSVAHQFAQAVLGLALLGHVVRLFVVAASDYEPNIDPELPPTRTDDPGLWWVRDRAGGGVLPGGDVGGDAQLAESFSVRFHHRDQPGAMVTYCYYAALDLDDLATIYVEQQAELLVCTDPADPEVRSDYRYTTLQRGFGSVEAATAAAKRAAEGRLVCDEPWSGRPPWLED
jgi:hypothetical protein